MELRGRRVEGLHGGGLVEVDHGVELVGDLRVEVVTHPLGARAVDHPDRALEPRRGERLVFVS